MFDQKQLLDLQIVDWAYCEEPLAQSFEHYDQWVSEGKNQPLDYLSDDRKDKRRSLKEFYPDYQSSISFLFSYREQREQLQNFYSSKNSNKLKIASYVFAFDDCDYHQKMKASLESLAIFLKESDPTLETKLSIDLHPVLDRDLAARSGLGWFGKNSMLIHKEHGSFTLIGSLLFNKKLSLPKRVLETDHCGQCTRCIDACPTDAIDMETRTLEARKCISTWTIEIFKPEKMESPLKMNEASGEIFGCDICQDVCPWNTRLQRINPISEVFDTNDSKIASFFLSRDLKEILADLESWSNKKFQKYFAGTSLERTGRLGLLKNLKFWLENQDL